MIVATVVEEWDHGSIRVRTNPTCEMYVDHPTVCERPATVRVNLWPHWSTFWCLEHAELLSDPARTLGPWFNPNDLERPTFQRRATP